jgi:hypothetical protein
LEHYQRLYRSNGHLPQLIAEPDNA